MIGRSALAPAEVAGRACHWLLDLDVGGRILRFAEVPVVATTARGEAVPYGSGLGDLEITRGEDPTTASVTLSGAGVDWPLLVSRGLDLASCKATLRRWYEGQVLDVARVMVSGRVTEPAYGGPLQPLEFGLERTGWDDTVTVPPASAVIDVRTWPLAGEFDEVGAPASLDPDEGVLGAVYPWIFGRPAWAANGPFWGATVGSFNLTGPGSPAYLAEYGDGALTDSLSKLVIAGHEIQAAEVHVTRASTDGARAGWDVEVLPVRYATDRLGQRVAYVSQADASALAMVPGEEWWVTWYGEFGGGRWNAERTDCMRGAGEIAQFLLEAAGRPVARGRMVAARARLDRFLLDFALTEPVKPEDWIEEHLGEILPIVHRETGDGIWYELWRYDATEADVEADLEVGRNVTRESAVTYTALDEVVNEITFRYAAMLGDQFGRSLTMTGRPEPDPDAGEVGSLVCQVSRSRYGARPVTIECAVIGDPASAGLAVQTLARWRALPRRRVTVAGGLELDGLDVNSVVRFTDPELYIARALALVRSITLSLVGVSLELELLDDPARMTRSTS